MSKLARKLRISDVDVVALVFYRYEVDLSIKTGERQRRGANPESASTYQIMGNRPVHYSYRQFLKGSGNKAALADFVTRYVLENARERLPTDCFIIWIGTTCFQFFARSDLEHFLIVPSSWNRDGGTAASSYLSTVFKSTSRCLDTDNRRRNSTLDHGNDNFQALPRAAESHHCLPRHYVPETPAPAFI